MIKILYIEKKKLCAPNPKTVIDKIRMSLITNAQIIIMRKNRHHIDIKLDVFNRIERIGMCKLVLLSDRNAFLR